PPRFSPSVLQADLDLGQHVTRIHFPPPSPRRAARSFAHRRTFCDNRSSPPSCSHAHSPPHTASEIASANASSAPYLLARSSPCASERTAASWYARSKSAQNSSVSR